jgi:hypothetical protein
MDTDKTQDGTYFYGASSEETLRTFENDKKALTEALAPVVACGDVARFTQFLTCGKDLTDDVVESVTEEKARARGKDKRGKWKKKDHDEEARVRVRVEDKGLHLAKLVPNVKPDGTPVVESLAEHLAYGNVGKKRLVAEELKRLVDWWTKEEGKKEGSAVQSLVELRKKATQMTDRIVEAFRKATEDVERETPADHVMEELLMSRSGEVTEEKKARMELMARLEKYFSKELGSYPSRPLGFKDNALHYELDWKFSAGTMLRFVAPALYVEAMAYLEELKSEYPALMGIPVVFKDVRSRMFSGGPDVQEFQMKSMMPLYNGLMKGKLGSRLSLAKRTHDSFVFRLEPLDGTDGANELSEELNRLGYGDLVRLTTFRHVVTKVLTKNQTSGARVCTKKLYLHVFPDNTFRKYGMKPEDQVDLFSTLTQ